MIARESPMQLSDLLSDFDEQLTRSDLIAVIHELHKHVKIDIIVESIKNTLQAKKIKKRLPKENTSDKRIFCMEKYRQRMVAMKFLYSGERYCGFARQDHIEETVEKYLFETMQRTKLITSIDDCCYSRCGRTDKGVSAFGQVIGIKVRSNVPIDAELLDVDSLDQVPSGGRVRVKTQDGRIRKITEVDYAASLNRTLPSDIRIYSVVNAPNNFSARFNCDRGRSYRYFFMKKNLDIEKMRLAAIDFEGLHDFRNFCRIDTNCQTFNRNIRSFEIKSSEEIGNRNPYHQMYYFEVHGNAFLWHQVRCMVSILFLIGQGREEPSIVKKMLNIEKHPRKPQYAIAPDHPLVLHDCRFDSINFDYSPLPLSHLYREISALYEHHKIKSAILESWLDEMDLFEVDPLRAVEQYHHHAPRLERLLIDKNIIVKDNAARLKSVKWSEIHPLLAQCSRRTHSPLLKRDTGLSVREKKDRMNDRKRRRDLMKQDEQLGGLLA